MPSRLFAQLRIPTPAQFDKNNLLSKRHSSSASASDEDLTSSAAAAMDHVKRASIAGLTKRVGSHERSKDRSSSSKDGRHTRDASHAASAAPVAPPAPLRVNLVMESPPSLFIGSPQQSTGILISGRLQLTPTGGEVILEDLIMFLECTNTIKRPVQDRCRECSTRVVDLYEWRFLSKPKVFSPLDGTHDLPFSHLIPGHLPATTHGALGGIDYSLHIRGRASDGQVIDFRRELIIQRALIPGPDKNSVRIFPPTDLTLYLTLPNIVHPIGEFPVQCRMTGITTKRDDTQTRWRLRKLTWRVEEHEAAISPPCAKHAAKIGGEGKGIQHEYSRELAGDELKAGWKTDFSAGQIEGEFLVSIPSAARPQTSLDAPASATALKLSHHLVLELVIAEEWAPAHKPLVAATPTGAARVLRTQFHLNVTQRAGLGISWDDESPPTYEDVPASPPHYPQTTVEDYDGDVSL